MRSALLYLSIVIGTCLFIQAAVFASLLLGRDQAIPIAQAVGPLWRPDRWFRETITYGLFDPVLTQRYRPNSKTGVLDINEHGFIGNGTDDPVLTRFPAKPEGVFRIFLLGSSSTAGIALRSDNTQTIAAYLERELNAQPAGAAAFQVLNYGVSGGWSFSEQRRFFAEIIHLTPDMVINFDGWADGITASFESARHDVEQSMLNWSNLSYRYFESMNDVSRGQNSSSPEFSFPFNALGEWSSFGDEQDERRRELYRTHHLTALSAYLERQHDGLQFALTLNLEAISACCTVNAIFHLAYLQPYAERLRYPVDEEQAVLDEFHARTDVHRSELWRRETYRMVMVRMVMGEAYDKFGSDFARYAAKFLGDRYVRVRDVTRLFLDVPETVYLDSIHYNERGNELIAQMMAQDILRAIRTSDPQ